MNFLSVPLAAGYSASRVETPCLLSSPTARTRLTRESSLNAVPASRLYSCYVKSANYYYIYQACFFLPVPLVLDMMPLAWKPRVCSPSPPPKPGSPARQAKTLFPQADCLPRRNVSQLTFVPGNNASRMEIPGSAHFIHRQSQVCPRDKPQRGFGKPAVFPDINPAN